jgi:peptidyl-tRNA hydrolase
MSGCKNKEKLAREKAAAEYAMKVEQAKQDLLSIINDEGNMSLEQKESKLQRVKDMNINEPEILALIRQAEDVIAAEKEEMRRQWEEKNNNKVIENVMSLNDYFALIAGASSIDMANLKINEALKLFAAPSTPVLIIISQEGDITDYDKPTTAKKYLEYLKDQKKNLNEIGNIEYDDNGKIKLLELIKKDY